MNKWYHWKRTSRYSFLYLLVPVVVAFILDPASNQDQQSYLASLQESYYSSTFLWDTYLQMLTSLVSNPTMVIKLVMLINALIIGIVFYRYIQYTIIGLLFLFHPMIVNLYYGHLRQGLAVGLASVVVFSRLKRIYKIIIIIIMGIYLHNSIFILIPILLLGGISKSFGGSSDLPRYILAFLMLCIVATLLIVFESGLYQQAIAKMNVFYIDRVNVRTGYEQIFLIFVIFISLLASAKYKYEVYAGIIAALCYIISYHELYFASRLFEAAFILYVNSQLELGKSRLGVLFAGLSVVYIVGMNLVRYL